MITALRTAQRVPFLSFITRMSTSSHNVALTSQKLSLPEIPELFDSNYLDVLLPASTPSTAKPPAPAGPSNVLMEALKEVSNRTHTENDAPALKSTLSGTLDAFTALTSYSTAEEMAKHLDKAWAEEPNLALRMIWQLRSVHDGKGDKEAFYRAWSWLYDNHPRTAIVNLHLLCEPVCTIKKKKKEGALGAHGYWKDILNILALATNGQLGQKYPKFLHNFVEKTEEKNTKAPIRRGKRKAPGSTTDHPESDTPKIPVEENNARQKELAQARKITLADERFSLLELAVKQPKYRALYIATARLFAAQLITDISTLYRAMDMKESKDRRVQLRQISLASKWAPTMGGAHDLNTNISTAIGQLLYHSRDQIPISFPSTLQNADITSRDKDLALRYFYQRWILAPLRKTLELPERRMTANEWDKINYNRVASLCMKKNNEHFLTHDPEGFQKYLIDVESGKKSISGATLMPNELLYEILKYSMAKDNKPGKMPLLEEYRRQIADSKLRVAEAQWATLLQRVADAGTIENSLAICDVSGSMGGIGSSAKEPIMPALALTLILARVSKPPFNNGFITFSATPEFIQIDPTASVSNTVTNIVKSAWSMNTDFRAVFLDLLLPLAKNNNVKPEDMVKRLFVFSDMQFDSASTTYDRSRHFYDVETEDADKVAKDWETTYDAIEKAYVEAGYEVPQIVFWDLGNGGTKEVTADRKGVAMMNGFSAAMFKVFMGETEDDDGFDKLEDEFGKAKQDEFNPLNILKKSLMKESYDGLVVVD